MRPWSFYRTLLLYVSLLAPIRAGVPAETAECDVSTEVQTSVPRGWGKCYSPPSLIMPPHRLILVLFRECVVLVLAFRLVRGGCNQLVPNARPADSTSTSCWQAGTALIHETLVQSSILQTVPLSLLRSLLSFSSVFPAQPRLPHA